MKILISGITGFVGNNLKNYLIGDYSIQGISRNSSEKFLSYKELNNQVLNKSTAFVHLAGKAHDLKKTSEDKEYFEVNTELTKKLFNLFLDSTCETFIYMSSVKAAADKISGELKETEIPNPITVYGKSKLAAEQYILSKELPKNKRVYILRPCMIHGPNNKGNLNLLYSFVAKGIPFPLGKFKNKRSFLSVDNLSFVIKELVERKDIKSGIYNVADDSSISTSQLVKKIGKVIEKKVIVYSTPKLIIHFLAKLGDLLYLPITTERIDKLTENYCVSNKKIINALGKKMPLTLEEGIEKTINSFKNKL